MKKSKLGKSSICICGRWFANREVELITQIKVLLPLVHFLQVKVIR